MDRYGYSDTPPAFPLGTGFAWNQVATEVRDIPTGLVASISTYSIAESFALASKNHAASQPFWVSDDGLNPNQALKAPPVRKTSYSYSG